MRYGIPYKGSKSRLVDLIVKILPKGKPVRDVFGGGGAVTLACLDSGYYNQVNYNELDPDIYNLFTALCNGELNIKEIKSKFITRDEFFEIKNKEHKTPLDNALLLCYSFGNNMSSYMYGKDIELRKQLLHKIHFKQIKDKRNLDDILQLMTDSRIFKLKDGTQYRVYFSRPYDEYIQDEYPRTSLRKYVIKREKINGGHIDIEPKKEELQSLQRLQSLESLESLERLERLETINTYNKDYRDLNIPEGDIIYCDPPYEDSSGYKIGMFDSDLFRQRVEEKSKTNPIFISSYKGRPGREYISTGKGNIFSKKGGKHTDHKEYIYYKNMS